MSDARERNYKDTIGVNGRKLGRPRMDRETRIQNTIARAVLPGLQERIGWAQHELERTIDLLEKNPRDHVLASAVVSRKKELVDLRALLPRRKNAADS